MAAGEEIRTVEDAAQSIIAGAQLDYGEVLIKARAGKLFLVQVTHQLKPEDARKVRV